MNLLAKVVTIRNRWLLRVFWGKRAAYPDEVSAALGLWGFWLARDRLAFFRRVEVVSGARKHGSCARRLGKDKKPDARQLQAGF